MHSHNTTNRPDSTFPSLAGGGTIIRERLVRRHNVCQRKLDSRSPVSVGNGEFAFTVDLTGLQSLPDSYPVGARDELPAGTLLGTQAQWGWHATPPAEPYTLEGSTVLYDSPRGPVPYVDMMGYIVNDRETDTSRAETWLRANPHRLDLGRVGFRLLEDGTERALTKADIADAEQTLDLWTGVVTSRFTLAGIPVTVTTACHPGRDEIGLRVASPALGKGLVVGIGFPYGSEAWHDAADWNSPDAHITRLEQPVHSGLHSGATSWTAMRELDAARYEVVVTGSGLAVEQTGQHHLRVSPQATAEGIPEVLDLTVAFIPAAKGGCVPRGDTRPTQAATEQGSGAEAGTAVVPSDGSSLSAGSAVAAPPRRTGQHSGHRVVPSSSTRRTIPAPGNWNAG